MRPMGDRLSARERFVQNPLWELSTIIVPLIPHYPWLGTAVLDRVPWVEQQLARLN